MSQATPGDLTRAAQWMSNGDLALTAKAVFSVVSLNKRNEAARMALVRELAQRGIDPSTMGYKGGFVPLNPNPKEDPTVKKARTDQARADRATKTAQTEVNRAAKKLEQAGAQAKREQAKASADRIKAEATAAREQRARERLPESERAFWDQQRPKATA